MTEQTRADKAPGGWRDLWRRGVPEVWQVLTPALPLVGYLVAGILPVGLIHLEHANPIAAIAVGAGVYAVVLWSYPGWRRWGWTISLFAVAWTSLQAAAPWRTYDGLLLDDEAFAYAEVEIVDSAATAFRLPGVATPRSVEARVLRLRLSRDADWMPCGGRVLLRFDDPAPDVSYGQRFQVAAAFRRPWGAAVDGDFDYGNYLQSRGILHLAHVLEREELPADPSLGTRLRGGLYTARDAVIASLVRDVPDPDAQAVLAAMTMGYRQGIEADDRHTYLRSGMVHLFAISGLHVGVLFTLVMAVLVLTRMPFSARHFLAPALVLIYVAVTGFAPSALRAWLMLTIWSAGRGWKRESMPINAVLVAAALLLLRPFNLFQSGFQYSFTIVLCLLLGWGQTMRLVGWVNERQLWHAGRLPAWRYHGGRFRTRVLAACCAMVAAWLGGVGLSAIHNQLFLPFGAAINLVAGLIVWPIFAVAALKLTLATIGLDSLAAGLGHLLARIVWLIRELAAIGSDYGAVRHIPRPPLVLVLAYYLALLALLGGRGAVRRLQLPAVATGALLLALACGLPRVQQRPAVTVLMPAGQVVPVIVLQPPRGAEPVLIGSGDDYFGFTLQAWLRVHGHHGIDTLVLLDNTALHAGGAVDLLAEHPARTILFALDNRRNLAALETAAGSAHSRLRRLEPTDGPREYGTWRVEKTEHRDGGDYAIDFRWLPDPTLHRLEIRHHSLTGTTIRYLRDGTLLVERHYPYRSELHEDPLLRTW